MYGRRKLRRFRDEQGTLFEVCCGKSHTRPFELDGDGNIELEELEDGWFNLIQFGTRVKVKEVRGDE